MTLIVFFLFKLSGIRSEFPTDNILSVRVARTVLVERVAFGREGEESKFEAIKIKATNPKLRGAADVKIRV